MEGKLIKLELSEGYRLDDLNGNYIASTLNGKNKLSLKNCQAIENGYDLDELACDEIGIDISVIKHIDNKVIENDSVSTPIHEAGALGAGLYHRVKGFEIGFQKALEILSDKKSILSEEDLHRVIDMARLQGEESFLVKHSNEEIIESLQQTEWDVEIEMWFHGTRHKKGEWIPKLDADGCLILKRK